LAYRVFQEVRVSFQNRSSLAGGALFRVVMLISILGAFGVWNSAAVFAQEPTLEGAAGASVSLSADQQFFGGAGEVTLHVTITNRNGHPIRMLKWLAPLADLEGPLFVVTLDGKPVPYLGKLVKRVPPTEADYITLAPGDSLARDVDLARYYDLSVSGKYAIEYDVAPPESYGAEGGRQAKSADRLVSNTLELFVEGRAKGMAQDVIPTDVTGTTGFVGCTSSRQTDLVNARASASTYANNAVAFFSAGKWGSRYATWFGLYDASRYSTVSSHYTAIRNAMDTADPMTFDCTCTDANVYAYVYPSSPYTIYLCGAFWSAPMTGTDSKAGTLIHETSHFYVVAGTVDHVYGQSGAAALAISNPAYAIENADNHEYFAENNPVLAEFAATPVLVSPINNVTVNTGTPTYTWNAVAQAEQYYLYVYNGGTQRVGQSFTAAAAGCGAGTGTCSVTPGISLTAGAAVWRVAIQTAALGQGPWSADGTFTANPSYSNHLSINDVSVAEGNSGTTNATFTVSLSPASDVAVTVAYQTANGTATATGSGVTQRSNPTSISVPSSGAATPYPSTITVPAGLGSLQKVTATLSGFSHTWPPDLDVLLVGPAGQTVVLMSDVGSSTAVTNLTFVFDDTGPAMGTGTLVSGTYRPTNIGTGDSWTSPAPAGPYGTTLSVYNGTDPAGVWSLYVVDDASGDVGSFSGGWSLTLTTPGQPGDYASASGTLTIPAGATSGTITVTVNGDTEVEPNETFFVNLSNPTNATIDDAQGLGTILNDDGGSARGDFTGDLKSDILWRHATRGEVWLWPMDGAARLSSTFVRTVSDTNFEIRGVGDQNGDGTADVLWRNKVNGQIYFWPMNGTVPQGEVYIGTVDPAYDIVGTGDFDGDGKSDILWRNLVNGDVWIWLMDGPTPLAQTYVDRVVPGYVVSGVGDLDGNGMADIVWHGAAGDVWVWPMNGTTLLDQVWVATVPDTGYQIRGVGDFTGDGKADVVWHHATVGDVWIWTMNGSVRQAETWVGTVPDIGYEIVGTGDYDGNGKADILWHHATRGEVWVWLMDGTTRLSVSYVATVQDTGYQVIR
jgi:peptidyl-Lys metalloendopeptidase